MRMYNIYGKLVEKNVKKYLIDWSKECRSIVQYKTKKFLEQYWRYNVVYEEFPVYGSKLKVDILNATKKIAVEINGNQHYEFNKFFHNNSREVFLQSINRDMKKIDWLAKNGYTLLEISEDEVPLLSHQFILEKFGLDLNE